MKNLPVHKLLYPALAAAALLSAAGGLIYAATFQNYDECRCAPGPNNATTYTWDKCCGNSAWVSDYAQTSNCCTNSSSFKTANPSKCTTSSPCSSITCAANQIPSGVTTYTTDSSVCCKNCPSPQVNNGSGVCKTKCTTANAGCSAGFSVVTTAYVEDGNCCKCASTSTNSGICCSDPLNVQQPPTGMCKVCTAANGGAGYCCGANGLGGTAQCGFI